MRVDELCVIFKKGEKMDQVRKLTEGEIAGLCILYRRPRTSFRSEMTAPSGYKAPSRFAPLGSGSTRISFAPQGCTSKCRLPVTGFFHTLSSKKDIYYISHFDKIIMYKTTHTIGNIFSLDSSHSGSSSIGISKPSDSIPKPVGIAWEGAIHT
jgi:hypothetical protein